MKLLFDQNLSFRLCQRLDDLFPGSSQVRILGMAEVDDRLVWEYAKHNEFAVVTLDADFADLAGMYGPPPKVIWLRCGNQKTSFIESLLRRSAARMSEFEKDSSAACIEVY